MSTRLALWLGRQLFKRKVFFYTLSGALAGGGIERIANILADYWSIRRIVFVVDAIWAMLLITGGIFLALIAEKIERVDKLMEWESDLMEWQLALKGLQDNGAVTPEIRLNEYQELQKEREKEQKKLYPEVSRSFLLAVVLLGIALPGLVFSHKPSPAPQHPVVHLKCNPCTAMVGESVHLSWNADGATEAFLNGDRVPVRASRIVWPEQSTTYHLHAVSPEGEAEIQITVQVHEPSTPTPTPKPSPSPTPSDVREPTPTREATSP